MVKRDFAIRKRQMIRSAQNSMFMIVAAASAIVGICLVSSWFLAKRLVFNQKIISEQNKTIATIEANYKHIKKIDDKVRVLKTNNLLLSKRTYDKETALQVILDALPDRANTPALGESFTRTILNVPGVHINQLSISRTEDEASSGFAGSGSVTYHKEFKDTKEPPIYFRFKLSGDGTALNQVLKNIENSIRPIFVDSFELQTSGRAQSGEENNQRHLLTVTGRSFYSHEAKLEITKKVIKDKNEKR